MRALVAIMTTVLPAMAAAETPILARAVACSVAGYDVIFQNVGSETLPVDAVLTWSVPFVRLKGEHVLEAALEPQQRVFLTGALVSTYLGRPKPCEAGLGQ
ncbi:hypothetical protein RNZ50_21320 [Paracoccaceae bacterium Fryx2]|nr:hypothetical protein [Paracoccaceae bacterium Fryx2]